MSKNYNGILLKHLFQLAEQDKQEEKLDHLFEETVKDMKVSYDNIKLSFTNGIEVGIIQAFDSYRMYISDPKFYENGENAYSPMGSDRCLYHLKNIAQFKYNWRNK